MNIPKKTLAILTGSIALFAVLVYAATLVSQTPVDFCHDFDGGVNVNVSSVTFVTVNGSFSTYTDFCMTNATLTEYACSSIGNQTYLETWSENCTCVNGACM